MKEAAKLYKILNGRENISTSEIQAQTQFRG
jgi:uncharacterized protein YfkK (UPF0435 family)